MSYEPMDIPVVGQPLDMNAQPLMINQPEYQDATGTNHHQQQQDESMQNFEYPQKPQKQPPQGQRRQGQPGPGQPQHVVVVASADGDYEFQAPLFTCTMTLCMNAVFLPYCLNARMENYISQVPESLIKRDPLSGVHMIPDSQTQRSDEIAEKTGSCSPWCAVAFLFDVGAGVATYFWPMFSVVGLGVLCQTIMVRTMLRKKYNIGPNFGHDCLVSWCCTPCSIAQVYTESTYYRNSDPRLICNCDNHIPKRQRPVVVAMQ